VYGRARTAEVVLVVEEKAGTRMKRKMNEILSVLSLGMLAKLRPVWNHKDDSGQYTKSNETARQIQKEIRDRNVVYGLRESGSKFHFSVETNTGLVINRLKKEKDCVEGMGLTASDDPCLLSTSPFSPLTGSFEYFRFSDINAAGDKRLREKNNPKAIARARGGGNLVRKSSAWTPNGTKYVGHGDVASGKKGVERERGQTRNIPALPSANTLSKLFLQASTLLILTFCSTGAETVADPRTQSSIPNSGHEGSEEQYDSVASSSSSSTSSHSSDDDQ
jgi:hypothetical protein